VIAARALALCALLLASLCAHAQGYPNRLVKIVVPYPPAGTIDLLARGLAPELSALWGQPVVVENIPGAGSLVGAERAANAPPDGYTLFMTVNPTVVGNRFLFKKLPYDPDKSFAPVSMIAQSGQFIVVHPSVPANTLKELIELARREPRARSPTARSATARSRSSCSRPSPNARACSSCMFPTRGLPTPSPRSSRGKSS